MLVIFGIAGGYAGCKYRKEIIIIGTSINGAYMIVIQGLALVFGGLASADEMAAKM